MKKNILLRVSLASAVIVCLSAFSIQFSPLFASFLPEGRTMDEAHDSGVIDWSGPASYISLWHRDSICPTGCNESVTRISNGGTVSGILAGDVTYFEVMVAATHNSSAGNAVLTACSASDTMNLYIGSGTGAPGLVSFPLTVPSGCTNWSLSASGGYVDFRSVDANYVSPPVLTDTPIPTDIPVNTDTPLPTAIPINTDTPSPTATSTDTPSQTVTPTDTPTPTDTSIVTLTSPVLSSNTPTFTSTSTSGIQSHTPTPVVPTAILQKTSTSSSGSVNNSNKSNSSVISIHASPTASAVKTNSVLIQKPTSMVTRRSTTPVFKTSTVIPASNSATLALVCSSSSTAGGAGTAGSKLLGILAAAGAAIGLGAAVKTIQQTIASWKQNSSGKSTIRVPHPCTRTTTVKEWVSKTVKTIVEVFKYITRTIVEAVARFINRVRQVIDSITHSEWVTSTRRVLKTVFETVIEKVPVLKWLAKIISYIYKTVIKPVLKWITETIRTLKTWVEQVIRFITERIQDGWNYITRTIVEKVKQFIEKSEIVGYWVTRTITVPGIEWVEIPVPSLVSNLLSTNVLKIIGELAGTALLAGAAISSCTTAVSPTPTEDPRVLTLVCGQTTQIAMNATLSAQAVSPTPTLTPTATPAWFVLPQTTYTVKEGEVSCLNIAAGYGLTVKQLIDANPESGLSEDCKTLKVGQTLTIPDFVVKSSSDCVTQYDCKDDPSGSKTCLKATDSAEVILTHVLFGEGGSTMGSSASSNILGVMTNRANQILRKYGKEPSSLSDAQYIQFLVNVASIPYYDKAGNKYASFNAFSNPIEYPAIDQPEITGWNDTIAIINSAVKSRGATTVVYKPDERIAENNVIAYCAPEPGSPLPGSDGKYSDLYYEVKDVNDAGRYQFYFSFQQFYNGYEYEGERVTGKDYCLTYANYQ